VHFNALYIGGSVGRKEISLKVLTHLFSDSDWQGGVDLSIETGEASWRVLQKLLESSLSCKFGNNLLLFCDGF
jgi:hypothetical protein